MVEFDQIAIEIRPAEKDQLDFLHSEFSSKNIIKYHHQRYEVQEKEDGVYLIAWHKDIPVAHFLLRWSGPNDKHITQHIDISKSAYLEAGGTREGYRRRGIATKMIQEAEKLAKKHGCRRIGLEVGSIDNPDARRLYEKLGYTDWGYGDFEISWEYLDKEGHKETQSEIVTYMSKDL